MSIPAERADTFGSLCLAWLAVENRDPFQLEACLEDARRTAPAAFPPDSGAAMHLSALIAELEAAGRIAGLLERAA